MSNFNYQPEAPKPQAPSFGLGLAASAGMGLVDNVSNLIFGKAIQKQQLEGQRKSLQQQNESALDLWNKTNYEAQKAHMENAGLNPGLLYGMSGGGGATTGGAAPIPQGAGIPNSVMQQGMALMNMKLMDAQIGNLNSQANKNNVEATKTAGVDTDLAKANVARINELTELAKEQTKNVRSQTALNDLNILNQRLEYDYKYRTLEDRIEQVSIATKHAREALKMIEDDAEILDATKDELIAQTYANLVKTRTETAYMQKGIEIGDQTIKESKARVEKILYDKLVDNYYVQSDKWAKSMDEILTEIQKENRDLTDQEKVIIEQSGRSLEGLLFRYAPTKRPKPIRGFGSGKTPAPVSRKMY